MQILDLRFIVMSKARNVLTAKDENIETILPVSVVLIYRNSVCTNRVDDEMRGITAFPTVR